MDCTFGGGGHSAELFKRVQNLKIIAIDRDPEAIDRGRRKFAKEIESGKLELHHCSITELFEAKNSQILGGRQIWAALADLGFSSDQLDESKRGFSFQEDSPLDMRMDTTRGATAYQLLQEKGEKEIADLIWKYGEERHSRKMAFAIVRERNRGALPKTARGLAELVAHSVPPAYRHGRIHPATRMFQALRIAVNSELEQLETLLSSMLDLSSKGMIPLMKEGARLGVISFHSLEDRMVKWSFREASQGEGFMIVTKKPIEATEIEIEANPRARSAKLRVIERV